MRRFDLLVPVCRLRCLSRVLELSSKLKEDHGLKFYVSNSRILEEVERRCEGISNVRVGGLPDSEMIGPAEARRLLQDAFMYDQDSSDVALFMDEDVVFDDRILGIVEGIENGVADIVGGWWTQEGFKPEVGQLWVRGLDSDGKKTVFKRFIAQDDIEVRQHVYIHVDQTMPVFATTREVLYNIEWDREYIYYYDHWDFFFQAAKKGYKSVVRTSAVTKHMPVGYTNVKDLYPSHASLDSATFYHKWGVMPIGPLSNQCSQS